MRKAAIFLPLALFALLAPIHLATGDGPFFLRWVNVSMGFFVALVACYFLKRRLFPDPPPDDDQRDPDPR